jgi:hypothetical protein
MVDRKSTLDLCSTQQTIMKKIKDYKLVTADNFQLFENSVKELLKSNWQPQGGVTFAAISGYCQAMVLYES